jgi:mRNA-degrading endonuclease RelE of RelBE toxin-antitoxin system
MAQIIDELEQRIDADAVAESWELEGRDIPPLQWDPDGDARVPGIRSVAISRRAARDLVALERAERDAVMRAIDALAHDASPRGAVALHGRARGHVQHRVGQSRLLYCVRAETVLVVAVTSGPA